ncbi:hypothetical protein LRS13_05960 [Svornostia abyssi]|uniref:Uncharacterized protein n=1 Tax=Svornostia abyssi TaxID=2898438 RepID=A0ABY5PK82_9ACTN|nr:hypothetical protein LRS13_05960 [Parviterribacteraceae bacterium J379]
MDMLPHAFSRAAAALTAACALLAAGPAVSGAVEITSAGPLTAVIAGEQLGCQVAHRNDSALELYPSSARPGDCGTFVVVGADLYAPVVSGAASAIGARTAWTPVSQTPVTGSGSSGSPFRVTTVAAAGATGLRASQVDSYIIGQESYRTDVTLQNTSGAALSGVIYRAGDCYLQSSDTGFGFANGTGAVGCSLTANNSPADRIEEWFPITGGNQYMQAAFSQVWAHIGTHTPFPNTTRAAERLDNGAGISWTYTLAPGASATFSHYTTFSPTGVSGPPPTNPASTTPTGAFGPNGVVETPSNRRCISRRYFRIRVPKRYWPNTVGVTVRMPKTTRVLRRPPWGTIVDLRGLPKGSFKVRITALLITGRTITGTRTYRTCRGKLTGGRPKL